MRNKTFKDAADKIQGPTRKIFIEFLERSCTAEFSGFLLYKELGRRLKTTNPVVAEIFTLMSRDEARHAGFINKALSDFNLALDLGFLTKNRSTPSSSPSSSSTPPTCLRRLATGATSPSTATCSATPTASSTRSSSTLRTGARTRTATETSSPPCSRPAPS